MDSQPPSMRLSPTHFAVALAATSTLFAQDACFLETLAPPVPFSMFGDSLTLTPDWILAGDPSATQFDQSAFLVTGSLNVFDKSDRSLVTTVFAPDFVEGQAFGASSAAFGSFVAIGAPATEVINYTGPLPPGAVHLYETAGTTFNYLGKLESDPPNANDQFGRSIAMSDDRLVVADPEFDRVHVYQRTGSSFDLETTFAAPGIVPFGDFVEIVDDVIVTTAVNPNGVARTYVYALAGANWALVADLPDPLAQQAVLSNEEPRALDFDGDRIVVGAPGGAADGRGVVHVFRKAGTTFIFESTLTSPTADELFGTSVALHGAHVVVGDPGLLFQIEEVYRFVDTGAGWVQTDITTSTSVPVSNGAGYLVAADPDLILTAGVRVYEASASALTLGAGVGGATGTPTIELAPCNGYASGLGFTVQPVPPSTLGLLLVAPAGFAFPFFGTTLYAAPPFLAQIWHNSTANGDASFHFPWNDGVSGRRFVAQAFYLDLTLPDMVASSNGVAIYAP